MKNYIALFAALSMLCTGCAITSVNYSPRVQNTPGIYATTFDGRYERQLDLRAVTAAFAQSSTIEEFEYRLNNRYGVVNNLDLNRDGYIDYLRVLGTRDRNAHVFLIQAVLGPNILQDVATIVVENPRSNNCIVEIVGSPYIYGATYILRPVYIQRPRIFTHLGEYTYHAWRSPWYWHHYPTFYQRRRAYTYGYYDSCVTKYMSGHSYCHQVTYRDNCYYSGYDRIIHRDVRNDYGTKYPERSYSVRYPDKPAPGTSAVERAEAAKRQQSQGTANSTVSRSSSTGSSSSATSRGNSSSSSGTTVNSGSRSNSNSGSRSNASSSSGSKNNTNASSGNSTSAKRSSGSSSTGSTNASRSSSSSSSASNTRSGSGSSRNSNAASGSRSQNSGSTENSNNTNSRRSN